MGIEWGKESYHSKEMAKWDLPRSNPNHPLGRLDNTMFPMMLYRAQHNPVTKRQECMIKEDEVSLDQTRVILSAEQFNSSCQLVVNDERELERARSDGWRKSPKEAMERWDNIQHEIAVAAAERNYTDRNISDAAKAEVAAVEQKSVKHIAEIPESYVPPKAVEVAAPKAKRPYKRKVKPAPVEA